MSKHLPGLVDYEILWVDMIHASLRSHEIEEWVTNRASIMVVPVARLAQFIPNSMAPNIKFPFRRDHGSMRLDGLTCMDICDLVKTRGRSQNLNHSSSTVLAQGAEQNETVPNLELPSSNE